MRHVCSFKLLSLLLFASSAFQASAADDDSRWTSEFQVKREEFKSTGRNPFFILEPGYTLVLKGDDEELTITVLDETKEVDGVETRIVEEHETKGGKVIEVSRNFFAISARTNSVYYFGEEVDNYKDGKVANHEGKWLAGEKGAKFGMIMPGEALLGARHYQEMAPKEAMDRAEVVSLNEKIEGHGHTYEHCLKTEETTPLEPKEREHKFYAPGIGLVREAGMTLVSYNSVGKVNK